MGKAAPGEVTGLDVMMYSRLREGTNHYLMLFDLRERAKLIGQKLAFPMSGSPEAQSDVYFTNVLELSRAIDIFFAMLACEHDLELEITTRVTSKGSRYTSETVEMVLCVYHQSEKVFLTEKSQEKSFTSYISALGYGIVECGNRALKRKRANEQPPT